MGRLTHMIGAHLDIADRKLEEPTGSPISRKVPSVADVDVRVSPVAPFIAATVAPPSGSPD
jgi:hypothetical protein